MSHSSHACSRSRTGRWTADVPSLSKTLRRGTGRTAQNVELIHSALLIPQASLTETGPRRALQTKKYPDFSENLDSEPLQN